MELRKALLINHKKVQYLLQQDFHATALNQKWGTDVSKLRCAEGKLYLSLIKGLFNGEIIVYELARTPNFEQITAMMKQAVARLNGQNRYYILTKVGNIKWRVIERY